MPDFEIHDDDCDEILVDGFCHRCKVAPDAQSVAIVHEVPESRWELRKRAAREAQANEAQANATIDKIRDALPPGPALYLWDAVASVVAERDRLQARVDELLVTVRNLSLTTPYPEEAGNAATLIAEVGTLKARVAELERRMR